MSSGLDVVIRGSRVSEALKTIAGKVLSRERITPEEGLLMYREAPVAFLGMLANHIREERHGDRTYFNRNFHIEPTNVCVISSQSYCVGSGRKGRTFISRDSRRWSWTICSARRR